MSQICAFFRPSICGDDDWCLSRKTAAATHRHLMFVVESGHLSLFHSRRHFSVPYTIIMQITQYGSILFSFAGWRQPTQTTTDNDVGCKFWLLFFFLMCECVVARTDKLNSRNTRLLGRWCRQQLGAPFLYLKKKTIHKAYALAKRLNCIFRWYLIERLCGREWLWSNYKIPPATDGRHFREYIFFLSEYTDSRFSYS